MEPFVPASSDGWVEGNGAQYNWMVPYDLRPLFTQVVVSRPGGATLTINAPAASTTTPYVTALKVNGVSTTRTWLPESFVNSGGTVDFTLSGTPDVNWGSGSADAPPSFRDGE